MRIIKYREPYLNKFSRYVDIGACEKHYDFLPLYNEDKEVYNNWYLDFIQLPMGIQMLTLHYYLLEYNLEEHLPNVLKEKISNNIEFLNVFNQKWFEPDAPFFRELDLNWEDIEERISSTKEDNNGIRTEVELVDGGVIKFLDDDDTIQSFYVLEHQYPELKKEMEDILSKLK